MAIHFGKNKNLGIKKIPIVSGHVGEYDVFVLEDVITIQKGIDVISKKKVKGISDFIKNAKAFRTGWAKFEDWEVIYFYDKEDSNYGYAVNLQVPDFSEWGYAPFR